MMEYGLGQPVGIKYPIWAWYQWEGKRKRRDLREGSLEKRGEKAVQLTIEIADSDVLLSDFDAFHYVLNYWYLPEDERDGKSFEREYTRLGFSWHDLQNFDIQTQAMKNTRATIEKSWDRIFDLEKEDENLIYGLNSQKSIQATFWQLKIEQVTKTEMFTAK